MLILLIIAYLGFG